MSHTIDTAHSRKTREIVASLPIASSLGVSAWVSSVSRTSINIVG
jgi:hypothetical protein